MEVFGLPLGDTPDGVANMGGNVGEWVRDNHDSSFYGAGPCVDCVNLAPAMFQSIRGGSYATDPVNLRSASRFAGGASAYISEATGFRCARD